jgi:hypothetical protein
MDHKSAMDSMGGAHHEEKPKKEIKHIEVKKGKSGGHIITHHHTHPSHAPEEHATGSDDQMMDHMTEHMTTPGPSEQAADAGQTGMPAAAGAPAAAAPAGAAPAGGM